MLFSHPWIAIIGFIIISLLIQMRGRKAFFGYSNIDVVDTKTSIFQRVIQKVPFVLLYFIIGTFFLLVAHPQLEKNSYFRTVKSKDIIVIMDLSYSMENMFNLGQESYVLPKRFQLPNLKEGSAKRKLNLAKKVAIDFIKKRKEDRFGLIVFGDKAMASWPLTFDQKVIIKKILDLGNQLDRGITGYMGGTAMGLAIEAAIDYLEIDKTTHAGNPILIFLSDGEGNIPPGQLTGITYNLMIRKAHFYWISLDQISMKSEHNPIHNIVRALPGISKMFLATDVIGLHTIFDEINRIEKHEYRLEIIGKEMDLSPYISVFLTCLIILYVVIRSYKL